MKNCHLDVAIASPAATFFALCGEKQNTAKGGAGDEGLCAFVDSASFLPF
tara:strand:+ start:145 stop:294 length:150 start_codon:yes stop_codon:yes gene_type:complete